ncbi:FkbM family methyltransferase [Rhizobium terrae]|uniref:FkbM family methyltransferase n=1 Tax=Rhizobium terrae TaxID=2171756 RepID=UPI000E3DAA00|nr:FkbM family methyltransferase [Rhizobium terrae]
MGIRTWLGLKKKPASPARPPFWNENSFSQLQQDRWALSELNGKRGGFFVEIGAFDGKQLSNSYLMETEYDWQGILVEPNPAFGDTLRQTRKAALCTQPVDATSGKSVTMRFVTGQPEFSSMAEHAFKDKHAEKRRQESVEVTQTTISLNDMLEQYNAPSVIDFISIDTEGNEPDILSTFDLDRFRVRLFCIEHNNTEANAKLDAMLLPKGYERVYRDWSRWDAWYRKL